MNNMIELLIIIFSGIAAAGYLIWFFCRSSAKQACSSCAFCAKDAGKKNTCSSICRNIKDCGTGKKNNGISKAKIQVLSDKRQGDKIDSA